jgi:hypothetical protein
MVRRLGPLNVLDLRRSNRRRTAAGVYSGVDWVLQLKHQTRDDR